MSIDSYLIAQILLVSPNNTTYLSPPNIEPALLGQYIREKLDESQEISPYKMADMVNAMGFENFDDKDFMFLNKKNTLNNRKKLYRNMKSLTIYSDKNMIKIYPSHQTNLDEFKGIWIDNKQLCFKYPVNIKNEDLGNAIYDACNYCTSIYSHYLSY